MLATGTCLPSAAGLYALDTKTGTIRTILAFSTGDEPLASWSPDGRLIAFSRTEADLKNDPNPVYQIWVVQSRRQRSATGHDVRSGSIVPDVVA